MREVALPDYRSTPVTLTFWASESAIAAFAGADVTVAKYYDFDEDFLLHKEPRVNHYRVYED